jgi:two-component system, chemotaxis family, CheB/CheR fusion protein
MSSAPTPESNSEKVPSASPAPPFPLVGLGASAGGIQALQTFFDSMPAESGMAFVVIMHLSPHHESSLAQVLQTRTAMPILQVMEQTSVAPNHVYVIPPNKHLILQDSRIELVEPQQATGKRLAIDLFFRTLAAAYGSRAVAVVLSGTDSDGAIGIKHIKEQGGLTLAQEPKEAEFDGMPRSAISTGMVDWILPVAQMPPRLLEFLRNEARMRVPPEEPQSEADAQAEDRNSGGPLTIRTVASASDEEALLEVLHFVHAQTGHDFARYKRATILRRVARRLQVNLLETISAYLDFLRTHPAEATALLHDLLISVTNFFRDSDAFAALASQLPQLFADKAASDQVRVWVAGCATGEEAYSIAMLLIEYATRLEAPPSLQVFATDLDERVIQVARSGLYPATIEVDVSPERLRRFFLKDEGRYRIKKELRERVLFSAHNLLADSPFSRLDLVSCRNLLIYLKHDAQQAVFDLFHFALRPGGLLFLGSAESVAAGHALFAPLDKSHRLFVRRATPRPAWQLPSLAIGAPSTPVSSPLVPLPSALPVSIAEGANPPNTPAAQRRLSSFGDLHLSLLEQFAPPSVVVNAHYDIVHLSEHAMRFLELAGEPSLNLLQVVHSALRIELRTALFRAAHRHSNVTTAPIFLDREARPRQVILHVRPTRGTEAGRFFLVVFESVHEPGIAPLETPSPPDTMTRHLEDEIQHLRAQLNATVEQYEASLEELKAANEEQQSVNEEMRSTAEELETSKEELQATNEELTTLNQELKSNLNDLSRANGDLQNLMASTETGTIFLDRQLCIQRFTPRIRELFNLIPTDIGRPLSDITHKLNYQHFTEDSERVLETLLRSEREVDSDGRCFLARLLPYRTLDDRIDGVVLTFIDITERKRAEDAVHESEEQFRRAIEEAPIPIIMHAEDGTVLQISRTWTELTGYTSEAMLSFHAWLNTAYGEGAEMIRAYMQALFTGQQRSLNLEFPITTRSGETRYWNFSASAPGTLRDGRRFVVGMAIDITERKRATEMQLVLEHETTLLAERNRMAQELHDTLAQSFTGIKLQIDAAEQELRDEPNTAQRHLSRARQVAQESMIEARRSIEALRSPLLEGRNLTEALRYLAEQASNGIQVRVAVEGEARLLPPLIESDLYRIGQEALTNALRHARPQHVLIELTYWDVGVRLRIIDDGQGFDPQAHRAGFGLTGIEERALRSKAVLEIISEPGRGTEVIVTMALP